MFSILVTVCIHYICEPYVFRVQREEQNYYGSYLYRGVQPVTKYWCEEFAGYYITDVTMTTPETGINYYVNPKLIGFRGAEFLPETIQCWSSYRSHAQ